MVTVDNIRFAVNKLAATLQLVNDFERAVDERHFFTAQALARPIMEWSGRAVLIVRKPEKAWSGTLGNVVSEIFDDDIFTGPVGVTLRNTLRNLNAMVHGREDWTAMMPVLRPAARQSVEDALKLINETIVEAEFKPIDIKNFA